MKLQYAMDPWTIYEALDVLHEIADVIDIVEVGTNMILKYGLDAVRRVRDAFPEITILADMKIIDGGEYTAGLAFNAGADIATVMGFTNEVTVLGAIEAGKKHGKKSYIDMMCVPNIEEGAKKWVAAGADYVCVHNASDVLDMAEATANLTKVQKAVSTEHIVACGGINLDTIHIVKKFSPEIIVVGNGISKAKDKRERVLALKTKYQEA